MLKNRIRIIVLSALIIISLVGCALRDNNSTTTSESNVAPPVEQPQSEPNSTSEAQTPWDSEYGIEFFFVPDMTEEQDLYYTDYVGKLLYSGLLNTNWSVDDYSSLVEEIDGLGYGIGYVLLFAYEDIIGPDAMQKLFNEYNGVFPAGVIEDVLLIRFPFTAEQLHEILSNHYDVETDTYRYESVRGGEPIEAAVTDVNEFSENGQLFIRLSYEIYTGYSGLDYELNTYNYKTPGVLTLKQNVFGGYTFWSVEAGEQIEAPTVSDTSS